MKVYVDGELPKECFDCPCFRDDIEICCGLDDGIKDYHKFVEDSKCPLQTTQSLKQQVRKEVVEEIRERLKKANLEIMAPIDLYSYTDNFLYQVEKGENNEI